MPIAPLPTVTIATMAQFPKGYFLENLAVRKDGSVLITAVLQKELWCVPVRQADELAKPVLVHTFDHLITAVIEVEPDVFVLVLSDGYTTHESHLAQIDLNGWTFQDPIEPVIIYSFTDYRVRGLNGGCLVGPGVMLLADCFAALIWRVDLSAGGHAATARVWAADDTMAPDPDSEIAPPPQPGINGIHYGPTLGYVWYTSTAQKVFMRIPVHPATFDPSGDAEFVAAIDGADDFVIDEARGFGYLARHRPSTIDRVPLQPRHGSEVRHIAGDPFNPLLVGPSSAAWRRGPDDYGHFAYVTTDGGTTALPPDGILRNASLLRLEFLQSDAPAAPSPRAEP
jgi:hypothetical protein